MEKKIKLDFSGEAAVKIWNHVFKDPENECGGYLIGKRFCGSANSTNSIVLKNDEVLFKIYDVWYNKDAKGTSAQFAFQSKDAIAAYGYVTKNYLKNGERSAEIIGDYHSHGKFPAFVSKGEDQDLQKMGIGAVSELYLTYSPSHMTYIAVYKDENGRLHDTVIQNNWREENLSFRLASTGLTSTEKQMYVRNRS